MLDVLILVKQPFFDIVNRASDGMQRHREHGRAQRTAEDQKNLGGLDVGAQRPVRGVEHRIHDRPPGEEEADERCKVHRSYFRHKPARAMRLLSGGSNP